jgi:hypothetical protein
MTLDLRNPVALPPAKRPPFPSNSPPLNLSKARIRLF